VGTIKSEMEFAVLKTAGRCLAVKYMWIHEMPKVTARIMALQDENRCTVLYMIGFSSPIMNHALPAVCFAFL